MYFLAARVGTTVVYGQSSGVYDHYFNTFLSTTDLVWSFVQTISMIVVVMLICTYYGFTASGGPAGVGEAVGRAVRASMVVGALVGGLLGTAATIRQGYVDRLEAEFAADKVLLRFGAGELVGAAEAKLRGLPVDPGVIQRAVDGLRSQPGGEAIDTVVLACTHFPLLVDELSAAFGPGVRFVDGAAGIARRIAALTSGQPFARTKPDLALFTRDDGTLDALRGALHAAGLERTEILT